MAEESSIEFAQMLADTEARLAAVFADFKRAATRELRAREERERKLQEDRRNFEAEKAQVAHLSAQAEDRVRLNVGGHRFETTRQTLCAFPTSMLAAWFSGRHVLKTTSDGEVFIDRNGQYFGTILDYCRTKQPPPLPADEDEREALWREFDFFCLPVPGRVPQSPIYDIFSGGYELVHIPYTSPTFQGTRVRSAFTSTHACAIFQEQDRRTIAIWDTTTGQIYPQIHVDISHVGDGSPLALQYPYVTSTTTMDLKDIAVWDISSGEKRWQAEVPFTISYAGGLVIMDGLVVAVGLFTPLHPNDDGLGPMGIPMRAWRAETGELVWEATCTAVRKYGQGNGVDVSRRTTEHAYVLARDGRILIGDENVFAVYNVVSGEHVFTGSSSRPSVSVLSRFAHVHFEGNTMHLVSEDTIDGEVINEQGEVEYFPRQFIRASRWDLSLGTEMQKVTALPESGMMLLGLGENRKDFDLHTTCPPYNVMWYLHDNHISCIRWTPTGDTNTFHKQTLYIPGPQDFVGNGVEVFAGLAVFDNVLYFFGFEPGTSTDARRGDEIESLYVLKPVSRAVA
eukprot:comp22523_c0_seq1/m.34172 comp22523_c0_seq1/g.34172  ORF comp22523_c0_seq1/g.34172 comp22523_c0_seq1/m.34172 type:complete len:567 (-) comp22523_c0_seq1:176-1876(-)